MMYDDILYGSSINEGKELTNADVPSFLKLDGKALLYNGAKDTELVYFVPEVFFDNTSKTAIAEIQGQYVSMIGICNWAIVDKNGKVGETKPLQFPTMILCKPYKITKEKDYKLPNTEPDDYRILHFAVGDEVLSETRVPMMVDNVELMFKLICFNAKIPTTIPYDDLWKLLVENGRLNGFDYGVNYQLLGMLVAGIARNPKNPAEPFRFTDISKQHNYMPMSIRLIPKYISPYTAITSENWDDGIRASVLLSQMPEEDIPYSPLEKVVAQ